MHEPRPDHPPRTGEAALAAAVRELLAAGHVVRLDGVGVLRRAHEPARIEARPDGTRVLHPPRHGVRYEPESPDAR